MQISRCGRTFDYMLPQDIHVIFTAYNKKTPRFYIDAIKARHQNINVIGYNIKESSQFIGNKTIVLFEFKGILHTSTANQLLKTNRINHIYYKEEDILYVANCVLEYEGNNICCTDFHQGRDSALSNTLCVLSCNSCGRTWEKILTNVIGESITYCQCQRRNTFDGSFGAYFYVNCFIHNGEYVYKYGITHDLVSRNKAFEITNGFEVENIIAVLFESSLTANDLEDTLKYTNLINHMPHVKIKEGWTELTDAAGLEFIKDELRYMGKI